MKKLVLSFIFSVLGAFVFLGLHDSECIAKAYGSQTNIIYVDIEPLTEAEIVANGYRSVPGLSGLQAGDCIVSLMLQNNTGYAASGFAVHLSNAYYEAYLEPGETINAAYVAGPASAGLNLTVGYNSTMNQIGFSTMSGGADCTNSGAVAYAFLKRKSTAPATAPVPTASTEVNQLANRAKVAQPYIEVAPYNQTPNLLLEYLIGDIDGDGVITAYDASVLNTVISSTSVTLTAANAEAYFVASHSASGTYIDGMYEQNVFIFDVADVDQDGVLTTTDANQILDYFTSVMISLDPDNPDIGTIGYYVA